MFRYEIVTNGLINKTHNPFNIGMNELKNKDTVRKDAKIP